MPRRRNRPAATPPEDTGHDPSQAPTDAGPPNVPAATREMPALNRAPPYRTRVLPYRTNEPEWLAEFPQASRTVSS